MKKITKFNDEFELLYGKSLPDREREKGNYPVYGSSGIIDYHSKYLVKGPGIIIGRKGNVGSLYYSHNNFYPIDTTYYIKLLKNHNLKYVYYYLKTIGLEYLNTHAAIPGLNRDVVYSLEVAFQGKEIQDRIASILGAFDDLVEVNLRRIGVLEEVARLLYEEWFVHLRYPGHEDAEIIETPHGPTPKGWKWEKLVNVIELAYGKALKKDDRLEGKYPVYGSSGIVGTHKEYLAKGPTIIVGRKGNVGSIFWSVDSCYPIDTVFYVVTDLSLYYVYYNLHYQNFINSDAAVPGLSRNQAYTLPILVPLKELLDEFETQVIPIFNEIQILKQKNDILKITRDLLLPKLISGEIDVSDLDIQT